jgi:hypothetical protein
MLPLRLPRTDRTAVTDLTRFVGMTTSVTNLRFLGFVEPGLGPGFLPVRFFLGRPSKVQPFGAIFGKPPVQWHLGGIVLEVGCMYLTYKK